MMLNPDGVMLKKTQSRQEMFYIFNNSVYFVANSA